MSDRTVYAEEIVLVNRAEQKALTILFQTALSFYVYDNQFMILVDGGKVWITQLSRATTR